LWFTLPNIYYLLSGKTTISCSEKANQKALKRQLCTNLEGSKVIIRMSAANSRVQVSSQAFDKWMITTTKSHIMTKDQTEK
jgi:hypothetical protein